MNDHEDRLTTTQAADYLDVTRQTIASAAKRGEIGRQVQVPGVRGGFIYMFTRDELDAWKARNRHPGGRPKDETATPTPVAAA